MVGRPATTSDRSTTEVHFPRLRVGLVLLPGAQGHIHSSPARAFEIRLLPAGENGCGSEGGEEVHEAGDGAGPAGLVAGAEGGAGGGVKGFGKQKAIAPVRIG